MIESLKIKNFQSHKNSTLEFDPGVNVIIGSSDSGKTAIIRALRWLTWNRPAGDSIRSWWGGDTEVTLTLPTSTISRVKGKENLYKLDSLEFKAFGADVPKEIQKEINFNDLNLQQQLDRPFLLDDSPGEVAQHFNKVAQLDVIDSSMSNVKRWIREIEQDDKTKHKQLKELMEELKTYDYLDKMEEDVQAVEYLEKEKVSVFQQEAALKKIVEELQQIEEEISSCSGILNLEEQVVSLLSLFAQRRLLDDKQFELEKLVEEIEKVNQEYEETIQFLEIEKPLEYVFTILRKRDTLQEHCQTLKILIDDIGTTTRNIQTVQKEIEKLESQMPEICPFCGQRMPKI
ncbi:MAG: AAA family ATPase [Candidatus Thorarchaeota archaeon]